MTTLTIDGAAPTGAASRRDAVTRAGRLVEAFSLAAEQVGLARSTTSAAGIPGEATPRVLHVELGQQPYLMVRLLPGQVVEDVQAGEERLTAALGVDRVTITQRTRQVVRIDLNPPDPFATAFRVTNCVPSAYDPITFGLLESGQPLRDSLLHCGHLAAQGQTRSGKTRWAYGLLGQLAGASDIVIDGIDPTGKLLGPWEDHPQGGHLTTDPSYPAMEQVSKALVAEMRDRIASIPRDQDVLTVSPQYPLRLVVLEEWANVMTMAATAQGKRDGTDTELAKNTQQLIAECHKVGIRVLVLAQRMEAKILGGFNRNNFSYRFSFRTASKAGLELLHEGMDDLTARRHVAESSGIALCQAPGRTLTRMRGPEITSYADYVAGIDQTRPVAVDAAA